MLIVRSVTISLSFIILRKPTTSSYMKTINEDVEMEEETPEAQKYIVNPSLARRLPMLVRSNSEKDSIINCAIQHQESNAPDRLGGSIYQRWMAAFKVSTVGISEDDTLTVSRAPAGRLGAIVT
jgi:hypothetical protein